MYIRQSSRTYKGKTYINYVLVESILTPKGPRQKIICSLGDLRPRPHAEWLALAHKLSSALSGQADLLDTPAPDSEWQDLLAQSGGRRSPLVARPAPPPRHSRAGQRVAGSPRQKGSPPLPLRCLPTRLTRLPPTPTCWPSMSIKCAPRNRARPAPSTPVISFGNVWAWTQSSPKPASVSASGNSPAP